MLSYPDQPHNKLLATLCQVMGLPNDSFGHPDFKGSLSLG